MRAWNPYFCLNSLNCNGFKPTFCVYRTTIVTNTFSDVTMCYLVVWLSCCFVVWESFLRPGRRIPVVLSFPHSQGSSEQISCLPLTIRMQNHAIQHFVCHLPACRCKRLFTFAGTMIIILFGKSNGRTNKKHYFSSSDTGTTEVL